MSRTTSRGSPSKRRGGVPSRCRITKLSGSTGQTIWKYDVPEAPGRPSEADDWNPDSVPPVPGYDLAEMLAALRHNADASGDWRGGSTLTQQLAKLAFTGDDRSASRKLRELLYAVEMERTLGKGRILQLYLALAPWGDGVCGAERAAQVYLGKPAARLGPVSSAWLVSLLRNPDAQLHSWADERRIHRDRVREILTGMRPMSAAQRALALTQVEDWQP